MSRLLWGTACLALCLAGGLLSAEDEPRRAVDPARLFRFLDTDKDGKLSKAEFRKFAERLPRLKGRPRLIDYLFNRLDTDGDGFLTPAEFARITTFRERRVSKKPEEKKPAPGTAKKRYPKPAEALDVPLVPELWRRAPVKRLSPAELDELLARAQKADKVKPAPPATDGQFVRRVYLDLTGRLPTPQQARAFLAERGADRRAKLIDRLLESELFARQRARYWRDVMLARATDLRPLVAIPRRLALESWLSEQFRAGRSWSRIARELLTAEGELAARDPYRNGQVGLLLAHAMNDGPVERANDTARVFLGVNIQCAQCHDHPSDVWKRRHFHELAAYFGRLGERYRRRSTDRRFDIAIGLTARPFREYRMPDQDDPRRTKTVQPRFFLTEEAPRASDDRARRQALADVVTAADNYYFAAAFVNRVWAELLGQAFVEPVDGLGPMQQATCAEVLVRLAAAFRASGHDVRALYRTILNSQAYQRGLRLPDSLGEHGRFAGVHPTPLRAEAVWAALVGAVGRIDARAVIAGAPPRQYGGATPLYRVFGELFAFDPSLRADAVEGTVPQALLLMNNEVINAKIRATGDTDLARILKRFPRDEEAIRQVYLRALGRRPSAREMSVARAHIKEVGKRGEAFEDLLWALINSTEFRTRH
jgi:hypothetical protein